jgi:hypothetical protein
MNPTGFNEDSAGNVVAVEFAVVNAAPVVVPIMAGCQGKPLDTIPGILACCRPVLNLTAARGLGCIDLRPVATAPVVTPAPVPVI